MELAITILCWVVIAFLGIWGLALLTCAALWAAAFLLPLWEARKARKGGK